MGYFKFRSIYKMFVLWDMHTMKKWKFIVNELLTSQAG